MNKNQKLLLLLITTLIIGVVFFQKRPDLIESTETKVEASLVNNNEKPVIKEESDTSPQKVSGSNQLEEEFSDAMKELPTLSDLKTLTAEEVHDTPSMVMEGGMLIGEVHEAAQNDPARREDTLKFFKSCAENEELVPAIRALCWKKTLSQIVEWKIFLPISDAKVSAEIKALATKIP